MICLARANGDDTATDLSDVSQIVVSSPRNKYIGYSGDSQARGEQNLDSARASEWVAFATWGSTHLELATKSGECLLNEPIMRKLQPVFTI